MRVFRLLHLLAFVTLLCCTLSPLPAQQLIFDNTFRYNADELRDDYSGIGTCITQVAADTLLNSFAVPVGLSQPGHLEFLIFDETNGRLLYQSAPKSYTNDNGIVSLHHSDALTFTLQAGHQYDIGVLADVPLVYRWWFYGFETPALKPPYGYTQNGITSAGNLNANFNIYGGTFAHPHDDLAPGLVDMGLVLYAPAANVPAVPEPGSIALLISLCITGTGFLSRRKR